MCTAYKMEASETLGYNPEVPSDGSRVKLMDKPSSEGDG
jgi:hypothetical protein